MVVEFDRKDGLAIITLNRPEVRNAINREVAEKIEAALDEYEADSNLWAAILTANGKVFCAGADLKEIASGGRSPFTKRGGFAGMVKRERNKPLIAAIRGSALAGGTEIGLACDLIVCSEETQFGLPEVKRSLVAAAGGLFRLPRTIGMARALEMIMTGDPLSAQDAHDWGMVNRVVPTEKVMATAIELARRVSANSPLAVEASRRVATRAFIEADNDLWRASTDAFNEIAKTEDYKEGPRAFLEKRAPSWKGK